MLFPIAGFAQQPPDCSGYPEARVFLESQAWWWLSNKTDRVQTGDDFGHVHIGTCFPHAQTISGDVEFDVSHLADEVELEYFTDGFRNLNILGLSFEGDYTKTSGRLLTLQRKIL